ncbi:Pimeloyl-ACP methyl ester carboxylesterase [Polaromonas sp. OV174]|uniref:alpha/beta fold hydrolase n=1 Tax=Polaromonas sp. OV174 TaxID=1855300 RepID=UPI0008E5F85C|nr:alpha/beta fold hydrolase [Polaromonas sp. OV174]SFC43916.1 Pimeloyl-ACP methyl ester carboxylesterase [Polaromonas sp. OV174]
MQSDSTQLDVSASAGVTGGTAYSVYGEGPAVVLIHGVGMEQAVWARQVSSLARTHQVIVYDMLGHGASQDPCEGVKLAEYAVQLKRLLDHLKIASAVIVGHSMGALVALEFSLSYPERTRQLVALNAVFMRTPAQREAVQERARKLQQVGVAATVDSTIERWFGNPVPVELQADAQVVASFMRRVHHEGYARSYQLFATSDAVHADGFAKLAMPALFMTGELDPNSTPAMSEAMAGLAPQATLVVLEGARHMMNITSAERVNQELLKFIG